MADPTADTPTPADEATDAPQVPELATPADLDDGEPPKTDPLAFARELRDLLATLVPPDDVTIQDVEGNGYTARTAIPMRRQVQVLRELEALLGVSLGAGAATAMLAAMQAGDVGGFLGQLVQLLGQDSVLDSLDRAFSAAYPRVLRKAVAHAALVAEAEAEDDPPTRPTDLFSLEDLAAALVPFCIRLAAKVTSTVDGLTKVAR